MQEESLKFPRYLNDPVRVGGENGLTMVELIVLVISLFVSILVWKWAVAAVVLAGILMRVATHLWGAPVAAARQKMMRIVLPQSKSPTLQNPFANRWKC